MTARPMIDKARAEALFVSPVQPSQQPTAEDIRDAIADAVRRLGGCRGCAERMAAEFGEHPSEAARRMAWALEQVARLHAGRRAAAALAAPDPAPAGRSSGQSPAVADQLAELRARYTTAA